MLGVVFFAVIPILVLMKKPECRLEECRYSLRKSFRGQGSRKEF